MIGIGSTVGNYEVIAKLGSGAMGSVYLAEHPSIGKRVALKVIHTDLAANAEMVSRFFTEARAVTQIQNEHIIDVQNYGQTPEGDNFIIMEFLDGRGLGTLLKEQRVLPLRDALHVAVQVASGLSASHERGIVHRDLKPDNIFLIRRPHDPLFVKILDFGLAKLTQGGGALSHKTRAGSVLGTPHYMAPEQCEGRPDIDHRVDIYALGCILYEMLCGRVPFPGEGFGEVLVKHLREPPMLPSRISPNVPKSVEQIILHALAKKRDGRFRDMGEFLSALQDPDRYAGALLGDQPVDETVKHYAAAPAVAVSEQKTRMLDAPSLPPVGANSAATMILMDAPRLPVAAPPSPRLPPVQIAPVPQPPPPEASTFTGLDAPSRSRSSRAAVIVAGTLGAIALLGGGAWLAIGRTPAPPVVVATDPVGAEVWQGGKPVGQTPYVVRLARGDGVDLVFKRAGYAEARRRIVSDGSPALTFKLTPLPPPAEATPANEAPVDAAPRDKREKPVAQPAPRSPAGTEVTAHSAATPKKPKRFDVHPDDVVEPAF